MSLSVPAEPALEIGSDTGTVHVAEDSAEEDLPKLLLMMPLLTMMLRTLNCDPSLDNALLEVF